MNEASCADGLKLAPAPVDHAASVTATTATTTYMPVRGRRGLRVLVLTMLSPLLGPLMRVGDGSAWSNAWLAPTSGHGPAERGFEKANSKTARQRSKVDATPRKAARP